MISTGNLDAARRLACSLRSASAVRASQAPVSSSVAFLGGRRQILSALSHSSALASISLEHEFSASDCVRKSRLLHGGRADNTCRGVHGARGLRATKRSAGSDDQLARTSDPRSRTSRLRNPAAVGAAEYRLPAD